MRFAVAAFALLLMCGGTRAHEWYPWECCHEQDCWPTGEGEREPDPVFTPQGWRLHDGQVVPFRSTRPSPDGRFHVCRYGGHPRAGVIQPQDKPPCLWAPTGAS